MSLAMRIKNKASRMLSRLVSPDALDNGLFVDMAYRCILRRPADTGGREFYLNHLAAGTMTRDQMLTAMTESLEFANLVPPDLVMSLHKSRRQWIAGLPPARRILDLGGSCKDDPAGAMIFMGYPYHFDELVILDLPFEDRHRLARDGYQKVDQHESTQGPVRYVYGSMTDLEQFGDGEFDMVHSGQSIEHITEPEADKVLSHAMRVLAPGGWFCLDTPNRAATRLQGEGWIHPEHKIEYTHPQLATKLERAGFEIIEAKGLNHLPNSIAAGSFDLAEAAANQGVYDDIANCFAVAYRCRKPA